ncbi:SDR family NAD(P)-dependent oxidoreductase [Micromonospora parathelypteridis]|uniref:Probable oxidoreductase n=1 Tax=Micromonospora parathelypteridis TaxID=1839617 RepID=A0A840W9B7_9ACTN|nr:SDR family NAD(P)-dependent oxidoreductase [Micromonospora parathelypteridis]MBB5481608.1 NAD(P)-dependent dehydrogenase (short-subunit alcohol dehydrogenase family) [Micromonospora parathelypteridis]GGO29038.1 oxidoreductase [Micromonospora parathelypteridis]
MSRIITPYSAQSTAIEVIAGVDLAGRRAVVTGGASGIGLETARALATAGAEVTLAVRDTTAGERTAADIAAGGASGKVRVDHLDLSHRASIDAFVASWTGPLHILVNNAGVMALPELTRTVEGWETQFAINHLGHAELTLGLHDALTAARGARIVVVSSSAHQQSPVVFDDIHFTARPYEAWSAYGQSKTANILFTVALARKWAADGITANALHPGGIMTNLQRHLDDAQLRFVGALDEQGNRLSVPPGWKTPQQGAATSVLLAASPEIDGVTGRYFEDANEAIIAERADGRSGVLPYALDEKAADRLWDETLRLLGR